MPETDLRAPWVNKAKEVAGLFEYDDEVEVEYEEEGPAVVLNVDNPIKAEYLRRCMPEAYTFGNVELGVKIVPSNDEPTMGQIIKAAFIGNPVLSDVVTDPEHAAEYALFLPEVFQYESDDISSAYGITTKTYEDVAKGVLAVEAGTFICSDVLEEVFVPLD